MIRNLLFIALGGAIGSVLRYLTSLWTLKLIGQSWFFTGTTAANIIGCFLIGIVATILQEKGLMDNTIKLFLIVGLLGGFTTFSSFGLEGFDVATISLQKGLIYMGFQVATGIAGVWAGISIINWFAG
jgi:CrcB protein